jgi:hypothetical protein
VTKRFVVSVLVALIVQGCASSGGKAASASVTPFEGASPTSPSSRPPAASPSAVANDNPLIGEWQRKNSCKAFVAALKKAGLAGQMAKSLDGWVPDAKHLDPANPCAGAFDVIHSHFFTADGQFGSHDDHGQQVDDGDYAVTADSTLTFPSHAREFGAAVVVRFRVSPEDKLSFVVDVPKTCTGPCADAHAWALSAFYPGAFTRVP